MFGLYQSDANREGETGIHKRILCFREGNEGSDEDILEIKVYRCRGRRPCSPVLERYGGKKLGNGGSAKKDVQGNVRSVMTSSSEDF